MSTLASAYLGDAVYELYVRKHLFDNGCRKLKELHNKAVKFTAATAQSKIMEHLLPKLHSQEMDWFKRGRNSNAQKSKNTSTVKEYKYATGLECLFGNLYLTNPARLKQIFKYIVKYVREQND